MYIYPCTHLSVCLSIINLFIWRSIDPLWNILPVNQAIHLSWSICHMCIQETRLPTPSSSTCVQSEMSDMLSRIPTYLTIPNLLFKLEIDNYGSSAIDLMCKPQATYISCLYTVSACMKYTVTLNVKKIYQILQPTKIWDPPDPILQGAWPNII